MSFIDTLKTDEIYKIVDFDRMDDIKKAFNSPWKWKINQLLKEGAIEKVKKNGKGKFVSKAKAKK